MTAVSEISIRGGAAWERVVATIAVAVGVAPTWARNDPITDTSWGSVRVGTTTIISVTDNDPGDAVMLVLRVDDLLTAERALTEFEADFDPDSRGRLWVSVGAIQLVVDAEGDGRDVDSRAALYLVVQLTALLMSALEGLSPEAGARIGLTAADRDAVSHLTSRALWASTADLNQQGRTEFAQRVIARAAELAAEQGGEPL